MIPDINIWAVLLATLSTMVVGSVWYTPKVFGTRWMRLAKISNDDLTAGSAVGPILATLVVSFVSALVLAGSVDIAHEFYGGSWFVNSIVTAIFLWAGFTAARIITHDAFERRPVGLTLLTVSHEFVTFVVMAVIIGLLPA